MSYSKIKKIRISKYDTIWSKMVRERDQFCLVCGSPNNLAAHHYIGRMNKAVRLVLENGITLCPSHHVFNNDFSAHRTPKDFKIWFREKYPDRARLVEEKSIQTMSERNAIIEFIELIKERVI